jgi:hypothetical protein
MDVCSYAIDLTDAEYPLRRSEAQADFCWLK